MSDSSVSSSTSGSSNNSGGASASASSSSDSNSDSSESKTTSESLKSSPTTAESLADSPTTAETLSGGSNDSNDSGSENDQSGDAISDDGKSSGDTNSAARGLNNNPATDALNSISKNLDQSGLFNDVTHNELTNINSTLTQLSPDQTNQVVAGLSDQQLSIWTNEINSNGILGTGGLKDAERASLFDNLASDLDMHQLGRVHNAIDDADSREEFTESISRDKSSDEVRSMISDRVGTLQAAEAVSTLDGIDGDLEQLQNAQTMAKLSGDAYQDYATAAGPNSLELGTTRLNPDQMPPELGLTKDQLVDDTSGFHAAVYQHGQGADATYTVAFRGTEDITDWKTNALSGAGVETNQFRMADELVVQLTQNVGKENVAVAGHSLGGGLANYAAMKNEVHSTAFNAKGTTWKEQREIGNVDAVAEQFIQNYQVDGEILTGLQESAQAATNLPGLGVQDLVKTAPGPSTALPAIHPDGSEAGFFSFNAIDRHGMDYVLRGMEALIDNTETEALNQAFQAQN